MHSVKSRAVMTALGLWLSVPIQQAYACSGAQCAPALFLPFAGALPANAATIYWVPGRAADDIGGGYTTSEQLRFQCATGSATPRDIAFHGEVGSFGQILALDEALSAGDTCTIRNTQPACEPNNDGLDNVDHLSGEATFTITPSVNAPTSLGTLSADTPSNRTIQVAEDEGGCYRHVDVCGSSIALALSDAAQPWADALSYETSVDGARWAVSRTYQAPNVTGGSFMGRGQDLVFVATDSTDDTQRLMTTEGLGLTTGGTHTVVMRATLPGTDVMLETAPIEITLDCGHLDADPGEGCSCSIVGPRVNHSFAWIWSLAVVALLAVRRMRSRHVRTV